MNTDEVRRTCTGQPSASDETESASELSQPASERTTLHRYAHRAAYDRETIDAILDEGIVCHVGLRTDQGFPVVIPLPTGGTATSSTCTARRPAGSSATPAGRRSRSA